MFFYSPIFRMGHTNFQPRMLCTSDACCFEDVVHIRMAIIDPSQPFVCIYRPVRNASEILRDSPTVAFCLSSGWRHPTFINSIFWTWSVSKTPLFQVGYTRKALFGTMDIPRKKFTVFFGLKYLSIVSLQTLWRTT